METYFIPTKELRTMSVSELNKIIKTYENIDFGGTSYLLHAYLIQQKEEMSNFTEKLDVLMDYYTEKKNQGFNETLKEFMDSACLFLDVEIVQYLLQKGCKVDREGFRSSVRSPLFRTFIYNYLYINDEKMDIINEKNMIQIGKLLIQNGALLEIQDEGSQKVNFAEIAKNRKRTESINYIKELQHLFNPEQQKQWGRIRLSSIF